MMVDSEPADGTETTDTSETENSRTTESSRGSGRAGRWRYRRGPVEDNAGWSVFSYLISGMLFYGLIGWLVGRATHTGILFPLGMIVGLVLAIVLIIFRYGRP